MTRLIVLVGTPQHLRAEEAEAWLRKEAAALSMAAGVQRAVISPPASASVRVPSPWGGLIEIDRDSPDGVDMATCDDAWKDLLGDLHLLGMRPTVAVVGDPSELRP